MMKQLKAMFRAFLREKLQSLALITSLAIGLLPILCLLTLLRGTFWSPLPYPQLHRLAIIVEPGTGDRRDFHFLPSYDEFLLWRERTHTFSLMAALKGPPQDLAIIPPEGAAHLATCKYVAPGSLELLDFELLLGRPFSRSDYDPASPRVAIVSARYWKDRLEKSSDLSEVVVKIDGQPTQVIGILRGGSHFLHHQTDIWLPARPGERPPGHGWHVLARLRQDSSFAQAQSEMESLLDPGNEGHSRPRDVLVQPLVDYYLQSRYELGALKGTFLILQAFSLLVLVSALGNVANLVYSKRIAKQRDYAVHAALGANRLQLVWLQSRDLLFLSAAGGLLSALLAFWLARYAISIGPEALQRYSTSSALWIAALGLVLSLSSGLLIGIVILTFSRGESLLRVLTTSRSGMSGRRQASATQAVVACQIALALVLTVGAGLLTHSLIRILSVDPGYDSSNILLSQLRFPEDRYTDIGENGKRSINSRQVAVVNRLLRTLRETGQVESAAAANDFLDHPLVQYSVSDRDEDGLPYGLYYRPVTPAYFRTLRIPLKRGRWFRGAGSEHEPVAIVNESAASQLSRRSQMPSFVKLTGEKERRRIVGVVGDTRHLDLTTPPRPTLYVPLEQRMDPCPLCSRALTLTLFVRSTSPSALIPALRDLVAVEDPQVILSRTTIMGDLMARQNHELHFFLRLIGLFAILAVLLATTGVVAGISRLLAQRRRDFGVRIALGAAPARITAGIVAKTLLVASGGALFGILASLWLSRLLANHLFGVSTTDPLTIISSTVVLLAVLAFASYLLAVRVYSIDPRELLQAE